MSQTALRCRACNAPIVEAAGKKDRFCRNCGHPIMGTQAGTASDVLLEKACVLMKQGEFALAAAFLPILG